MEVISDSEFLIEPNIPVGSDEVVIGFVSKKAQNIYLEAVRIQSVIQDLQEKIGKDLDALKKDPSEDKERRYEDSDRKLYRERLRLGGRVSDLCLEISEDYPQIRPGQGLAIRRGWRLVSLPRGNRGTPVTGFEIPTNERWYIEA